MTGYKKTHDSDIFAGSLAVRTGDGREATIDPTLAVYCWHSGGIAEAVRLSVADLRTVRPDAVVLHSGSADLLANLRRAAAATRLALESSPSIVRIWVGLGIDGTIAAWRAGKLTTAQVVTRYAEVAALCESLGYVEVLMLNGESKWALAAGDTRTRAEVRDLADQLGAAIARYAPSVVIGLSSFGRLGYHADVRALIEGLTPHCSLFTGQSYAAAPGPAAKGALPSILAKDESSQEATERQGWLRGDDTTGDDSPDDLDRIPSIQGYKTNATDLTRVLCERYHVLVWALPVLDVGGRVDAAGIEAMRAAFAMRTHGPGPQCVRAYQREHGLTVDGTPGPVTRSHALAQSTS